MFTSYIKNLNDMVFSTSESPEEQPSTGVLGRIGSWFSPWRGKGPKSPTENASTTSDQSLKSEAEEESGEPVSPESGERRWEEEQEQSSSPNPLGLNTQIFPCEEEDATQSAHRDGSVASSTEAAGGGPREEEFGGSRKERTGQGEEREESSNGTSVSGNSERNVSHLTHLSSEQGVVWDSDQAQRQKHAQTGRRLHVYLEETSVIQRGQNTCAGQEVVRTKYKTDLQVIPKAKSSPNLESTKSPTGEENKRAHVRLVAGTESYYSALEGVSLKSRKDSQFEPEPDNDQTEPDTMGRKNSAKRRIRKNSQGDGSPQEKVAPNAESISEGFPSSDKTATSPQGKSPNTHKGESSVNSSPKHNATSQPSPEAGGSKTSCPDSVKKLDNIQDSNSVTAAAPACAVDGATNMEDDDSLYKVERKTETPESKRRSIKVSRSEVKLFTKNVPLNQKNSPTGDTRDFKSPLKTTKDEEKDKANTETDSRLNNLKKIDEEPKAVSGRIADKISLFERPAGGVNKQTFRTPRSADVSPVRGATERLKEVFVLSEQRSRSAERYGKGRSGSASPAREAPLTIKERVQNLTEASKTDSRPPKPPKPATTGMSQKSTSSVAVTASKSPELDNQGKLDAKELVQTNAVSEVTLKPDGLDASAVGGKISLPKEQTDTKTKDTLSKTADHGTKPNSVETDAQTKGPGDSAELTDNISPQSKVPSRTGSRSKRRKGKEPSSPINPSNENKPDGSTNKQEVAARKQQRGDDAAQNTSVSKTLSERVSLPSDKVQGTTSGKDSLSDNKQKAVKRDLKAVDTQKKQSDLSSKKENIDKPKKPVCQSVSKDEPDTVASSGTKAPIDKDPVMAAQKEEKVGGHNLLFTEEKENAAKDGKETPTPSPSPVAEQPVEKTPSKEQEPPVKHRKLDKESPVKSEPKSKGKVREPVKKGPTPQSQHKHPEAINLDESKDAEELKKAESVKTNQTEKKDKEKQLLDSAENVTKASASDGGRGVSGMPGSVVRDDEREKTGQTTDQTEPVTRQHETASGSSDEPPSDLCAQTRHAPASQPKKAAAAGATAPANEAGSGPESDKEPPKAATAAAHAPAERRKTASTEKPGTETQPLVIAAKPLPGSVSVEKNEKPSDDSCAHGANVAVPITKATTASEDVTIKATNSTPALISAQTDGVTEKESSVKEPAPVSAPKSANSEHAGRDDAKKSVKSAPSEVKKAGGTMKITPSEPHCEASKNTESAIDTSSVRGEDKTAQRRADVAASISTVDVEDKTTGKICHSLTKELSPVANGDISPHPQPQAVNEEPASDGPSQTLKPPAIPKTKSLNSGSIQRSSMKKLQLPRGLSRDDSSAHQDAPSSWLDVDFPKRKLKLPVPKLSSSGSESNLLDTSGELDDDDFIEKIKKLCSPFSLPPRKHNPLRPSQPPFAMPAIKEDRFEKTFDPEEFKFGLRKNNKFTVDTAPSLLAKRQSAEAKSGLKPARASLADRSMLLSSLDSHSRLRDKTPVKDEEDAPEEKDDQIKVKSRLEGSCVLNSLTASILKGKRNGIKAQAEGTSSADVSPSEAPQPSPPPPAPPKDTLAQRSPAPSNGEEARALEAAVGDSGPPLPSFNDIKLPDYLEKYLPREPAKPVQSTQGQERVMTEVIGQTAAPAPGHEVDVAMKPAPVLPDAVPPSFPGIPATTHSALPELKKPPAQPQRTLLNTIRTAKGFHKRPGKMVLFEKAPFSGQVYEIYRDVADATSFQLSPLISVKVVRGCWVLYEKPDFQGRSVALEEGGIELANVWAEPGLQDEPHTSPPMQIGSIRLAVGDYSVPRIDLFTEPEGRGRVTPYHDDTIETGSFGIPLSTASIQVHSGVWLVFSDPGFQGMLAVLETGVYPFPESWGFPSPFVGSLRPLKMGGFKVENPSEVKALVYEKPGFEGFCLEIDNDVLCFCESEEGISAGGASLDSQKLKSVGSLKIIGGLWVGYSEPGFEGQQHILEEGDYLDCRDWGGSEQLLSLRPVLADFLSPHLKMFSDRDFGELGVNIDITVPIINMDDTGYGMKTQSIDVIGGVWVVFEEPGFGGEPYILEKGLYGSPEDWGALQPRVGSAMPVVLDDFENAAKFKMQLFSEPGFQGSAVVLEDSVASLQDGFSVASCKVLAGSWLAFEGRDFSGKMYVLEVGSYPDLRAMGCFHTGSSILSLQTVGFEFSLPSITLFERSGLRGKRVILTDGSVNLQLTGGCGRVQSVLVEGGMWVLYEGINYRGAQILLKPGQVPDWHKLSSWLKIGSLRPLLQKQVHFRLRNRQTGLMMSVTGDLDDVKLLRIQETEDTGGFEQIWSFQNGHLHCKLLEECCLGPSGTVTMAGSRLGLSPEQGNEAHLWSITPEGFIRYSPSPDLVLEVKGGHHYDKNQVILNTLEPNKLQQRWNLEII